MNLSSPLEIYKGISAGSAQINPFSDYFQESEDDMKNMGPIFNGRGITRDIHAQMPFSCAERVSGTRDQGCDSSLPREASSMEAEDIPGPYLSDMYDYSNGVFFDYSTQNYKKVEQFMQSCDPLKGDTNKCLKDMFDCGEDEWDVCSKYIDYCPGESSNVICKYNLNKELIKRYVAPQILKVRTQPFCAFGETADDCLRRYGCTETDPECNLQTCEDDPNYVCKSNGQRFYNPSPVNVNVSSPDVIMFQKRGVGEFYAARSPTVQS